MLKPTRLVLLFVVGIIVLLWVLFEARDWNRSRRAMELCEAVYVGDEDRMRELLSNGVSPDWETVRGLSGRELAEREDCEWCELVFQDFANVAGTP